jgi:hypothetical protein
MVAMETMNLADLTMQAFHDLARQKFLSGEEMLPCPRCGAIVLESLVDTHIAWHTAIERELPIKADIRF